jgi:hypothetical protein
MPRQAQEVRQRRLREIMSNSRRKTSRSRRWLALIALLPGFVWADSFKPRLHEIKCKDINAIAKESVEYSLLGAWSEFTTHKCFKGDTFKFFNPSAGRPSSELIDSSQVIQFKKNRDSYKIKAVRKEDEEYRFDVEFTIDKKPLSTTFEYVPDPEYTGRTGICGFVVNPTHHIVRADCIDQAEWKRLANKK